MKLKKLLEAHLEAKGDVENLIDTYNSEIDNFEAMASRVSDLGRTMEQSIKTMRRYLKVGKTDAITELMADLKDEAHDLVDAM